MENTKAYQRPTAKAANPLSHYALLLAWLWLALVAYQLSATLAPSSPQSTSWVNFWRLDSNPEQLRDWVENFLLPIPAGLMFGLYHAAAGRPLGVALWRSLTPLLLVCAGMEILQWWMPERSAALSDILFLVAGGLTGVLAIWPVARRLCTWLSGAVGGLTGLSRAYAALWLLLFWIPAYLQLDRNIFASALAPLHAQVIFSPWTFLWGLAGWLGFAALAGVRTAWLWAALAVSWLGLLLTPGRVLGWDLMLGGAIALALWSLLARHPVRRLHLTMALLGLSILLVFLGWVPLQGRFTQVLFTSDGELLYGSWLSAASLVIQHSFPPVALAMMLAADNRPDLNKNLMILGGGVLLAELFRPLFDAGDIRFSVFLVYVLAVRAIVRTRSGDRQPASAWQRRLRLSPLYRRFDRFRDEFTTPALRRTLTQVFVGVAVIALGLGLLIQLPQVPYNVREMFGDRSAIIGLPLFGMFLIWTTGSPNLIARIIVKRPALQLLQPLFYLLMAVPSWLLLRYSVAAESLWDIVGSPVLGWPGDWELFVRYLAFVAPFLLALLYWNILLEGSKGGNRGLGAANLIAALLVGTPMLWLAKYVIIDQAATDNIRELIADFASWKAIIALGGVIGIITLNGVLLAWSTQWNWKRKLQLATLFPLGLVFAWWLLLQGLYADAVTFLLSPERDSNPGRMELLMRWALIYLGAVTVIAYGQFVAISLRGEGIPAVPSPQESLASHPPDDAAPGVGESRVTKQRSTLRSHAPRTPGRSLTTAHRPRVAAGGLVLLMVAVLAFGFPSYSVLLLIALAAYGAWLTYDHRAWLLVLPVVLAGINLSPWTGRIFLEIPDYFLAVTLAVYLFRPPREQAALGLSWPLLWGGGLLLVSLLSSVIIALIAAGLPTANSFADYLDPYNSLRILRGFVWPLLLWLPLRRAMSRPEVAGSYLLRGLVAALAVVVVVAVRERLLYTGLLDFDDDFRVISTFASMHVGGGHVGAFLVLAIPAALVLALRERSPGWRLLAIAVLLPATYTLLVTFARSAWAGVLVAVLTSGLLLWWGRRVGGQRGPNWASVALLATLLPTVGYLVMLTAQGSFAGKRISNIPQDLMGRVQIVTDAVGMMDTDLVSHLLGMGLGSFPRLYYERNPHGTVPTRREIVLEYGDSFLRSTGGPANTEKKVVHSLVGQRIDLESGRDYRLRLAARSQPGGRLSFQIHEKTVIYSNGGIELTDMPTFSPEWKYYEVGFNSGQMGSGPLMLRRSVMLFSTTGGRARRSIWTTWSCWMSTATICCPMVTSVPGTTIGASSRRTIQPIRPRTPMSACISNRACWGWSP